ncbi:hypothetical protein [Microbispora sp. NPDC049633]|uniref:hypothetical protein n=1 Tax=Microbispora sp. NPDC049633 TaxID=3154355 RepID=UPI003430799C
MDHVLYGLAVNPALPSDLLDRLVRTADEVVAARLAERADLTREQAAALVARDEDSAVELAERGLLTAGDIDPVAQPSAALALLAVGAGRPEWARLFAADPDPGRRERLAACPGLPADVAEALAADADIGVVAELALWTTADVAARLVVELLADDDQAVGEAAAANPSLPPAVMSALVSRCVGGG